MKYMLLVCGDDTADASGMAPVEPWVEEHGAERGVRLHGHRLQAPSACWRCCSCTTHGVVPASTRRAPW